MIMTDQSKGEVLYQQIQEEHDALRQLLGNVHHMISRQTESMSDVAEVFDKLKLQLQEHFREEEDEGFFDQVIMVEPRATERALAIRDEHGDLRLEIEALTKLATSGQGTGEWWKELDTRFHAFSKHLMHHEGKESELLQEVYTDDIGAAD